MDDISARITAVLDKDIGDKDKFMADCLILRDMGFSKEVSESLEVLAYTYSSLYNQTSKLLSICEKRL